MSAGRPNWHEGTMMHQEWELLDAFEGGKRVLLMSEPTSIERMIGQVPT